MRTIFHFFRGESKSCVAITANLISTQQTAQKTKWKEENRTKNATTRKFFRQISDATNGTRIHWNYLFDNYAIGHWFRWRLCRDVARDHGAICGNWLIIRLNWDRWMYLDCCTFAHDFCITWWCCWMNHFRCDCLLHHFFFFLKKKKWNQLKKHKKGTFTSDSEKNQLCYQYIGTKKQTIFFLIVSSEQNMTKSMSNERLNDKFYMYFLTFWIRFQWEI